MQTLAKEREARPRRPHSGRLSLQRPKFASGGVLTLERGAEKVGSVPVASNAAQASILSALFRHVIEQRSFRSPHIMLIDIGLGFLSLILQPIEKLLKVLPGASSSSGPKPIWRRCANSHFAREWRHKST